MSGPKVTMPMGASNASRFGNGSRNFGLVLLWCMLTMTLPTVAFSFQATTQPVRHARTSSLKLSNNHHHQPNDSTTNSNTRTNRRSILETLLLTTASLTIPASASAVSTEPPSTVPPPPPLITEAIPAVTHRVTFDIRISRQDGTFYVRDDLDTSIPENNVSYSTLTFELFGRVCPNAVAQFLKYVKSVGVEDPTYGRSTFVGLDQSTGLLTAGNIAGLEVTNFGGAAALQYGGRIVPAPLWVESRGPATTTTTEPSPSPSLTHSSLGGKGLLTHRTLDISPSFGITTRSTPELDASYTVFGRIAPDSNLKDFLNRVEDIPTYSEKGVPGDNVGNTVAGSIFATQRQLFRGAAKSFGDGRLDKVYEGKLLRRVEVTRVQLVEDDK